MRRFTLGFATALALLATTAASAGAATTIPVDDDGQATPKNCNAVSPASPTIQAAVTAASPGDTIAVCPGVYQEQVTIPDTKDRISLVSVDRRQAVIKAPASPTATYNPAPGMTDLVRIQGAENVVISRFVITGPFPDFLFCNADLVSAVRFRDGGSGNLLDNHITQAKSTNPALRGCQNGFGVQIGRNFEGQTGLGRLFGNLIDDYQKGGVYVDGPGSTLYGQGNTVRGPDLSGAGSSPTAAPNGVQISRGADSDFDFNVVVDNVFPGFPGADPGQASGFILFDNGADGDVRLQHNYVSNNDTNLALYNHDDGFFQKNVLLDADFYDGIYVDADSAGNKLVANQASGNAEHDCHDDSTGTGTAGTANEWSGNRGETQNRPGLCKDNGGGDPKPHPGKGHGLTGRGIHGFRP